MLAGGQRWLAAGLSTVACGGRALSHWLLRENEGSQAMRARTKIRNYKEEGGRRRSLKEKKDLPCWWWSAGRRAAGEKKNWVAWGWRRVFSLSFGFHVKNREEKGFIFLFGLCPIGLGVGFRLMNPQWVRTCFLISIERGFAIRTRFKVKLENTFWFHKSFKIFKM